MSLMGIDIGTTGCKVAAFDGRGALLALSYREYPLIQSCPGWMELDAEAVWDQVTPCIREVAAQIHRDPVSALAISSQGEAVVPVSREGRALALSIVTFDNRASQQSAELAARLGSDRVFAISGQPLHSMGTICKLAWWKQNEPELFERAWKFLCYGDFALMKLGLPPIIDHTMAARTMAFDIGRGQWSSEILTAAGVPVEKLAEPQPSGTLLGKLPTDIAKELGLPIGVQVAVGGHDQPCAALGAGVTEPGEAAYAVGTVECVTPVLDRFAPELGPAGYPCYPHVVPGKFVTLAFNFTGGSLLRWFRDTFAEPETELASARGADVYDLMLSDLPAEPTGLLVLPHFTMTGTPWLDTESTGAIIGLTLATTKKQLVKALLEGVTYEMAVNLRMLQRAGVSIKEFKATGGGARSAAWMQIKADILGRPVMTLDVSEAACLGAAVLAGWACGEYAAPEPTARSAARIQTTFTPNSQVQAQYEKLLNRYERVYPAVKAIGWTDLS